MSKELEDGSILEFLTDIVENAGRLRRLNNRLYRAIMRLETFFGDLKKLLTQDTIL